MTRVQKLCPSLRLPLRLVQEFSLADALSSLDLAPKVLLATDALWLALPTPSYSTEHKGNLQHFLEHSSPSSPPSPLPLTPGCLAVPRWEQRRNICLELCTNRTKNLPNNLGFVT